MSSHAGELFRIASVVVDLYERADLMKDFDESGTVGDFQASRDEWERLGAERGRVSKEVVGNPLWSELCEDVNSFDVLSDEDFFNLLLAVGRAGDDSRSWDECVADELARVESLGEHVKELRGEFDALGEDLDEPYSQYVALREKLSKANDVLYAIRYPLYGAFDSAYDSMSGSVALNDAQKFVLVTHFMVSYFYFYNGVNHSPVASVVNLVRAMDKYVSGI